MKVERRDNEIFVRISTGTRTSKIQAILDYLRYEELTSNSIAVPKDVDELVNDVKKHRWQKTKKRLKLDD